MGKGIKGIIIGSAIGAAVGLLYAPRSGRKTRALLAEKTEALWGEEAQNNGTILGEVAKKTKNVVETGSNFIDNATNGKLSVLKNDNIESEILNNEKEETFNKESVKPVFSERDEELCKKIDSAREKIASQVAKNIEESISSNDIENNQKDNNL